MGPRWNEGTRPTDRSVPPPHEKKEDGKDDVRKAEDEELGGTMRRQIATGLPCVAINTRGNVVVGNDSFQVIMCPLASATKWIHGRQHSLS